NRGVPGRLLLAAVVLCLLGRPSSVLACAACFGQSNDAMARGMNMGIFALLVVITFVLAGLASFAVFLARRSARFAQRPVGQAASPGAPAEASSSISQPTQSSLHGTVDQKAS